jgi:hypothetical protein
MVKPNINFTDALENVLARVWQVSGEKLSGAYIKKTREAIIDVRTIYRNKGEKLIGEKVKRYSQSIDFSQKRYRAGYIASFGERHAYLTYSHLKKVENIDITLIPQPLNGELTVTLIGAGAALELFGLCYYYNENRSKIRKLNVNFIERVNDWQSDRTSVCERILKEAFPKVQIFPNDITLNLIQDNILLLSNNYDSLAKSDIIIIYNILNEITARYYQAVWRNLEYILKICDKRVLILLMEPAAQYTRPRITPIVDKLEVFTKRILKAHEEEFFFNSGALKIRYEDSANGLNVRLFKSVNGGPKPSFERALKRTHFACFINPLSPISKYEAERQLRSSKGRKNNVNTKGKQEEQGDFNMIDTSFGNQKVNIKYLGEP